MQKWISEAAAKLIAQASDARALSRTFTDSQTVSDLDHFAGALERDANELMLETGELRRPVRKVSAIGRYR